MTRNTRDLSVGEAIDKLTALDSEQAVARANAIEAVAVRFEDKRAAIYARVPVELRASVDAMLDALTPKSAQSEPVALELDEESVNFAVELDGIPAGIRAPLPPERLAIGRVR